MQAKKGGIIKCYINTVFTHVIYNKSVIGNKMILLND